MSMFQRTVSLWQRLVGRQSASSVNIAEAAADERRIWVRYPSNVEITCQPASNGDMPTLARVRNISQGGISLLVSRCFESGTQLSVELPGGPGESSYHVLA